MEMRRRRAAGDQMCIKPLTLQILARRIGMWLNNFKRFDHSFAVNKRVQPRPRHLGAVRHREVRSDVRDQRKILVKPTDLIRSMSGQALGPKFQFAACCWKPCPAGLPKALVPSRYNVSISSEFSSASGTRNQRRGVLCNRSCVHPRI